MTATTVAEQVVLGRILEGDSSTFLQSAVEVLAPAAFADQSHQRVFAAICDLFLQGTPVGAAAVREKMHASGALERSGGVSTLEDAMIVAAGEPADAPGFYLAAIADTFRQRQLARELHAVAEALGGTLSVDEARGKVETAFADPSHTLNDLPDLSEQMDTFFNSLDERVKHPGVMLGVPTGWADLDGGTRDSMRILGGLRAGWLCVVCARPGVGKTTALLDFARAAASSGNGSILFSLEMSTAELLNKLIVAECATVTLTDLILDPHNMTPVQREQVENAATRILQWPLVIDDQSRTVAHMHRRAAAARTQFRSQGTDLKAVYQDYIQLIDAPEDFKGTAQHEVVSVNSTRMKVMGKLLEVPVTAAAQLRREGADRKPRPDDLAGSGQLERDADVVVGLHRPFATDPAKAVEDGHLPEDLIAIMLKNRWGQPGGQFSRTFFGAFSRTTEPQRLSRINTPPPPE